VSTSRAAILNAISQAVVRGPELPEIPNFALSGVDLPEKFIEMLQKVGGTARVVASRAECAALISQRCEELRCQSVLSRVDDCPGPLQYSRDENALTSFAAIDLAIVEAEGGVAENGAVWLRAAADRDRSLFFVVQHLIVILQRDQIVSTLHQAYAHQKFFPGEFAVLISGPSKTADIEQSLVIGAHGTRSHTVIIVD
jgi:L-lactate dehydrogenase complex protein LldG